MKKIFFIMSTDDFSGAESVNFSIIECLKEKYDFYWVSKRGNINKFLESQKIKFIEIENLTIREINRVIKEYRPDILHATDYKASTICALAKTKNIPLISHLHNNVPWLRKIHPFSFALLFVSFKSKKILTVSDSIKNEYIFSNLINKKIINIGNPIDRNKILNMVNPEDYKKIYDICCVGRLVKQKNPLKFIDIIYDIKKEKKDIKVLWIGKGELLEKCIAKCKLLELDENIKFIGFKNNPYQYMAQSKIFMLSSDWEGFGLVAFEAITLGLPAIVSNVGGLSSMIDNDCGMLCNKNNDFVNEAVKLLYDNKYYELKQNNALLKSKKIENINEYSYKLNEIYNSVLN